MSASQNDQTANAVSGQPGEVGSHVKPTPQHQPGHQPGRMVGNDAIPESHIQTLPAGTAPSDKTYVPNPTGETPGQAANPSTVGGTAASTTLGGSTSADVNTGIGKPAGGMSSAEAHHDGQAHRERQATGLQGVGASGAPHFDSK